MNCKNNPEQEKAMSGWTWFDNLSDASARRMGFLLVVGVAVAEISFILWLTL
jgi:hypothetical protein